MSLGQMDRAQRMKDHRREDSECVYTRVDTRMQNFPLAALAS